jgi:7,8-dihydropterin-6-yl-methyl-4-(beta-D-ribofuranosyl)aminobenzene 5'-phosphate synthase
MRFTVVYDNEAKGDFIADWGFSCLIESKIRILFDTGADPNILSHNISLIDVNDFDYIFLSHAHYDHVGGLKAVLDSTSHVIALKSFPKSLKDWISSKCELIEVQKILEFEKGFTAIAFEGFVDEQSLVIDTNLGLFVVTGCSHPGLDVILQHAERFGRVFGVMGGFHGFSRIDMLKNYDLVIPCHCTVYKREILRMPNAKPCFAGCSFEI